MNWKFWKTSYYSTSADSSTAVSILRISLGLIALYLVAAALIGIWWSREPDLFDVSANAQTYAKEDGVDNIVTGYTTATALHRIAPPHCATNPVATFLMTKRHPGYGSTTSPTGSLVRLLRSAI